MRKINNQSQVRSAVANCVHTLYAIKKSTPTSQPDRRALNETISLRRERQLAHSCGPAWRYMQAGIDECVASLTATPDVPPTDPLLDFLAMHSDEGPAIAAMWTSLHRSCTQHSEITETAVVAVRKLFHSLVRSRAFLAAAQLYRQLVDYGLSLRNHDVLLLLGNLPYEKSVGSSSEISHDSWLSSGNTTSWKRKKGSEARQSKSQPVRSVGSASPPLEKSSRPRTSKRWLERLRVYEAAMGHSTMVRSSVSADAAEDEPSEALSFDQPLWKDSNAVAALLHHLCFIHSQGQCKATPDTRGLWMEALHVISTQMSANRGKVEHPIAMPPVLISSVISSLHIVPPSAQWKFAVRLIASNIRCPRALEHELMRVLCVKLCPTLSAQPSLKPLRIIREAVNVASSRLSRENTSTYLSVAMATMIDRCRVNPTSQMLQSLKPALKRMLTVQLLECVRHFQSEGEESIDSQYVESSHRFIPSALEDNLALCTSAVSATASLLPLIEDLNRSTSSQCSSDELAWTAFFDDSGLVALREVLFSNKHRSNREIKAMKNAPERNVLLKHFFQAGVAWLMVLSPKESDHCTLAVERVSDILFWLSDVVGDMNLTFNRSAVQEDVLGVVAKVILRFGLHEQRNHSTLEASLAHRILKDRDAKVLCVSLIRLVAAILPLKSRAQAIRSLHFRDAIRVVLILSRASNSAGKFVRSQLSATNARHLDDFVTTLCESRKRVPRAFGHPSMLLHSSRNASCVYEIASSSATENEKSNSLKQLMSAKATWFEAAMLMHSILAGVRVAPTTVPQSLYLDAIERMRFPQPGENSVPIHAWNAANFCYRYALNAIPEGNQKLKIEITDSSVFPLMCIAISCSQVDEARTLSRSWLRSHALRSGELQIPPDTLIVTKILHAIKLGERDVLQRLLHHLRCSSSSSQLKAQLMPLLCQATQLSCYRSDWLRAIRLLDSHQEVLNTPEGTLSYLHCLDSSGSNLYQTSKKVFRECGANNWWSAEHSALVLRSFSRARKWQDALTILSSPSHVDLHLSSEAVIKEGLRACATGGQLEAAESLFSAFTKIAPTSPTQSSMKALLFRAMTKDFGRKTTSMPLATSPKYEFQVSPNVQL